MGQTRSCSCGERTVVRLIAARFDGAEIGRAAREAIVDPRQAITGIDGGRVFMKDEGDRPVTLPGGVRAHHTRCKNRLAIEQHTACLETARCLHLGPAFPELVVSIESLLHQKPPSGQ